MNEYKAETRANNIVSVILREKNILLPESSTKYIAEEIRYAEKRARAEVLAAVLAAFDKRKAVCDLDEELKQHGTIIAIFRHRIAELQPAAKDLETLLEKAHEAALPHAAERLLKALTEGGDFAVDSPLDKAKKRVEELLREAQMEIVKTSPECWHYNTETEREFVDRYFAWRERRIERLEKARAIVEKG
jgi:hypothetical protein